MRTNKVERARGTNDVLPPTSYIDRSIRDTLGRCFESFGYQPVEVPVLEPTELFLRKSGEDFISRLYDFTFHSRRLCLRPEMTASVARAYADGLQGEPLPLRLYYQGPVFRYEKPQRGRARQFTQMGVEAIGSLGPAGDAECVGIACRSLAALGLQNYRLEIGHIGLLRAFLTDLGLENRLGSFLTSQMEALHREGQAIVEARLQEIYPEFSPDGTSEENGGNSVSHLSQIFRKMDDGNARLAILELVNSIHISLAGNRDPEEIADRLLAKIARQEQTPLLHQAIAFMKELGQLAGEPKAALAEAEKLLASRQIESAAIEELRSLLQLLQHYQIDTNRLSLDLGMSRGLQYYTGAIFEIHFGTGTDAMQLCGGGRYDNLMLALGSRTDTPATGFGFGVERLRLALESEGLLPNVSIGPDVLAVPVSPQERGYAIALAENLRATGLRVEIDVRDRKVDRNLEYAHKRGIPFAAIVGADERIANEVVLKKMASGSQQRLPFAEAAKQIEILMATPDS